MATLTGNPTVRVRRGVRTAGNLYKSEGPKAGQWGEPT